MKVVEAAIPPAITRIIAGNGQSISDTFQGENIDREAAIFHHPISMAYLPGGHSDDLIIVDGNRIRRILNKTISTVLGNGIAATSPDGIVSEPSSFPINVPSSVVIDQDGNLIYW